MASKRSSWEKPSAGLNLHRVRDLVGDDLVDQVKDVTREFEMEVDVLAQGPHLDRARLRGIPAIGRGVAGVQPDSMVPGSDEHLDEMDVA